MNSFEMPKGQKSKGEAATYIMAKLGEVMPTGRIDSEPSDFRSIHQKMMNDEITPEEAITQIDELIASRMDYN